MIRVTFDYSRAIPGEEDVVRRLAGILEQNARKGEITVCFVDEVQSAVPTTDSPGTAPPEYSLVDRLDFVPVGTKCFHCQRTLRSGTGYWVKFKDGSEQPFGGTCVLKYFPKEKTAVHNFTRATGTNIGEAGGKDEGLAKTAYLPPAEEEYLRLRYERLEGFSIPGFALLDAIYSKMQSGGLDDTDRRFVRKIMDKMLSSPKGQGLSPENLQACYAYSHCLNQAVGHLPEEKREYLQKLMVDLKKRLYLTAGQIEAANKWLAKIKGMPVLDPAPFAWAAK